MKDDITLRGERELWLDFIHKAKKEKKKAWDVLYPFLKKYIIAGAENRVMLILFPMELVSQIVAQEDPDNFIEEAIRKQLAGEK